MRKYFQVSTEETSGPCTGEKTFAVFKRGNIGTVYLRENMFVDFKQ